MIINKLQIYVNLLWSYAEYQLEGTTDRNSADPLAGHLNLMLTKMHACVSVCVGPGCEEGDPDEGADASSFVGAQYPKSVLAVEAPVPKINPCSRGPNTKTQSLQ